MSKLEKVHENDQSITFALKNESGINVGFATYIKPNLNNGQWKIDNLHTTQGYRHQGYGTELLEKSCEAVQQIENTAIVVTPMGSMNPEILPAATPEEEISRAYQEKPKLVDWYRRHGFKGDEPTLIKEKASLDASYT
ncbi:MULTISPECIES: GNAT family N-acetyltransferase [Trichocoleus]|uniref:GNAT family N-acetyltransferase n=1 Tax=Trichocoleus desertorum GB2-A4 TaxID=2933944 RepID=A0ABV0JCZ8_9CYAN|nr:GNAT family N-acetyltransferase [Trichocoleus sp. FACHB-46]MBD1864291.1 GNAT family N-acetyltransferase [Trichocoleus sp. FACHB-46]